MDIDITLKNFRCFADQKPAAFSLRSNGFTGFVGVNNAGKSSLLKLFFELRQVFGHLTSPKQLIKSVRANSKRAFDIRPPISDKNELFYAGNERDIQITISATSPVADGHIPAPELLITIPRNTNEFLVAFPKLNNQDLPDDSIVEQWLFNVKGPGGSSTRLSLQPLCEAMDALGTAMYIGAFRNAINIGTKEDYFDIQIGESFIKKWREYKTGPVTAHADASYRLQRDIESLFGFDSLEINPTHDDKSLHFFINGNPFKLAEVGGGIAQFIIVLANVAIHKPSFVLIDEPELNLHPTLQMDFLTTIASLATEGGVAFSTHNYGLARAMADRIYSVRMNNGVSEVRDLETTPRLSEFVGELTFSGYRELGFDGVLLVEGRTDVKTIQQFLRMYKKDHRFVLVPLGGSAGITEHSESELLEIKRISPNIAVLIDSERDAPDSPVPKDRQTFQELCENADIPCTILTRRATENYLAEHAVKKVKGDKYRAIGEHELLRDAPMGWGKHENWRIAREMRREDLEGTDLGQFLADL